MSGARIEQGISPDGRENKGITSEELSILVPDFYRIIHERLYDRGILPRGQEIELTFPALPHPDSQAQYLYENTIGDDWVFIAFLGPNKETSRHKHFHEDLRTEEHYELLRGKMLLYSGDDGSTMDELTEINTSFVIPPDTFHRSRTDGNFALYMAIMPGAAPISHDRLHLSS